MSWVLIGLVAWLLLCVFYVAVFWLGGQRRN